MSIDDRDYMRDRNRTSDTEVRRFRTSEQQKQRQADQLRQRFSKYSRSPTRVAAHKAGWKRIFVLLLVLVIGAIFLNKAPGPAHAPNATWQGELKLLGKTQEGIEPLEFYRTGNQRMGHHIDLNGRLNGNLKTRRASFFGILGYLGISDCYFFDSY